MAMSVSSSSSSRCIPTAASQLTASRGHVAALQGLCMPRSSLKNARAVAMPGSCLLPSLRGTPLRCTEERKGCWLSDRPAMVRASSIGVVEKVEQVSKEKIFYNVVLRVSWDSEVAKWYDTPGMYVDMIPTKTNQTRAAAFFIASSPKRLLGAKYRILEFLIEDVENSVANEIINSNAGDTVVITPNAYSKGFDVNELYPAESFESVLMFASGYGLGPIRALIETGFEANKRQHAILYTMYTPGQEPYTNRHAEWANMGVTVQNGAPNIISTNPSKTVVPMVASTVQQEFLTDYFEKRGVPDDKILTLFSGITVTAKAFYNKVLHKIPHYPKFPHSGEKLVPVELKL